MSISMQLTPESKRKIEKLVKARKFDLRATFKTLGHSYRKEVKGIYDHKQPRLAGQRWEPLNPIYADYKELKYPGAPLLVRTGDLRKSMTELGAKGNIQTILSHQATFGSSIYYGVFHDEGTSKMPKRNFSEPSDKRLGIWKDLLARDIIRNFKKNGVSVEGAIFD